MSHGKTSNGDLGKAVNAFLATYECDKVPKGYLTVAAWAPHLGVNSRQAWNVIHRFARVGHATEASFRIKQRSMIRPVVHYRFSPAALKALGLTRLFR